ncbi:NGB1 protein, partial [Polyodon spathula]|nr:neuroglobin-1-like isoform X1 [Polyodon spathula]MBN3277506.1 NGB1 protein [Polyodon spathula]
MGCALSGPGVNPGSRTAPEANESGSDTVTGTGYRLKSAPLPLSEAQKDLIRESWKILHEDIARVGIIMFIRLFETHPECKDVFFMFREIDDLQELKMSKELQAHGLRVMSFIEKSVARLSQEDKLEQIAFELGRSHCRYSAPPKYYEYVGVQFISAVKPIVKENWTQAVEESWQSLFLYLTEVMKRGYHEEERKNGVNKTSYGTQAPSMWAEVTGAVHNKV